MEFRPVPNEIIFDIEVGYCSISCIGKLMLYKFLIKVVMQKQIFKVSLWCWCAFPVGDNNIV